MPGIQQLKTYRSFRPASPSGEIGPSWPELVVPDLVTPDLAVDEPAGRGLLLRQTIEQRVVPHLLALHPPAREAAPMQPALTEPFTQEEIAALARCAVGGRPEPMFDSLTALLQSGVTPEALCLDVLAPAARHLGDLWLQDECHFVDVTIGVARLHQALRRLAPLVRARAGRAMRVRSILMVPVPGEQHHFGLAMAADFFRRAGWSVSSGMSPRLEALRALVRARYFDVVGFSASCDRHAEMLASALRQVRQSSLNTAVVTMVGGPLFALQPELAIQLGADAVATEGGDAPALAASMLPDPGDHHRSEPGQVSRRAGIAVSGEPEHSDRRASSSTNGDRVRQPRSGDHQKDRSGGR